MTTAQLLSRQANADRRARDLKPTVTYLGYDYWIVKSVRGDRTYLLDADKDGLHCNCAAGEAGLPCYHVSAVLAAVAATPEPGALAA